MSMCDTYFLDSVNFAPRAAQVHRYGAMGSSTCRAWGPHLHKPALKTRAKQHAGNAICAPIGRCLAAKEQNASG